MRIVDLEDINKQAKKDPGDFVACCEKEYAEKIEETANIIAKRSKKCPIALLSGPSASGKTTTAKRIQIRLEESGIHSHIISMDDYFSTRAFGNTPLDENGKEDLESPLCLDIALLNKHLAALSEGQEIQVPKFDFKSQSRMDITESLKLQKDEIAVIEGIHALNDAITGSIGEKTTKIYISARTRIGKSGKVIVRPEWIRLMRRIVRDNNFRGASAEKTLALWKNIRRGETLYIMPYKNSADIQFDTFLDYESCVLAPVSSNELKQVHGELLKESKAEGLMNVVDLFTQIRQDFIPSDSLLREFVGGSSIHY
ncbi:MAG: nucleoside kinase [Clostridiales bacterium]|nr:nucleoside kinase [Clostridiales bacterium]